MGLLLFRDANLLDEDLARDAKEDWQGSAEKQQLSNNKTNSPNTKCKQLPQQMLLLLLQTYR